MQLDTTTIIIIVGAIIAVGVIVFTRKPDILDMNAPKTLMVLQPSSKRYFDLPVHETESSLEGKRENIDHRYYKAGPGWVGKKGAVRFLGIEGNAYTAIVKDNAPVKMRLSQAVKILLGDAYEKMPAPQRQIIEHHVFGVTVVPEEIPLIDKNRMVSGESVDDETDKKALKHLANAMKDKGKMDWTNVLLGFLGGALIVWMAANMHWIKVA